MGIRCADPARCGRWSARRYGIMAVLLLSAVSTSCGSDAVPQRHVVELSGFRFSPETVRAAVGDTVVWVNSDVVPHTTTARAAQWDSGVLPSAGTWQLVLNEPGEMAYECTLHPSMTGTIVAGRTGRRR